MTKRTLEVDLTDEIWNRIDRLVDALEYLHTLDDFVTDLLNHVQQGVYRFGAWERDWLVQCVGPDAVESASDSDFAPHNVKEDFEK